MEQKIQEIIEENGAKNTGKLRIFDNTLNAMLLSNKLYQSNYRGR